MVVKIDLNKYVSPYIFELEGEDRYTLVNGYIDDDVVITGKMPEIESPVIGVMAGTKVRFTVPSDCHNAVTATRVGAPTYLTPGDTYEWVISEGDERILACATLDNSTGDEDLFEVLPSGLRHNHFYFGIMGLGESDLTGDEVKTKVPSGTEVDFNRDGYNSMGGVVYSTDDNGYIVLKPASDIPDIIPWVVITEGHTVTVSPETAPNYYADSEQVTNDGSPITDNYITFCDTDYRDQFDVVWGPREIVSTILPLYEKEAEDGTYLITPSKVGTQNILNIANATRALSNKDKAHTLATISADLTEARGVVNARNQAYEDRIAEFGDAGSIPLEWVTIVNKIGGYNELVIYAEKGTMSVTIQANTNGYASLYRIFDNPEGELSYGYAETIVSDWMFPQMGDEVASDSWQEFNNDSSWDSTSYLTYRTFVLEFEVPESGYYVLRLNPRSDSVTFLNHCSAKVLSDEVGSVVPTSEFLEDQPDILMLILDFRTPANYMATFARISQPDTSHIPLVKGEWPDWLVQ